MPGLGPGIRAAPLRVQNSRAQSLSDVVRGDVDGRVKPGHDGLHYLEITPFRLPNTSVFRWPPPEMSISAPVM